MPQARTPARQYRGPQTPPTSLHGGVRDIGSAYCMHPAHDMSTQTQVNTGAEPFVTRARRAARSVGGALRTHYPGFIFGLPLARNAIPVFVYHDVDPTAFASDLTFLRRNGYRTLGLEEFVSLSARKSGAPGRSVLLTFDDARKNFFETALPVLRDFQARATLFAPTYWMRDTHQFMSWDQIRTSLDTGLVDVQSHGHRHALVLTSDRLLGFATPRALARYDIYDWPLRNTLAGAVSGRPLLGTPVYAATPLLSAARRYLEDPGVTAECVSHVERSGGAGYFDQTDALPRLRRLHARGASRSPGRFMCPGPFRSLLGSEFDLSREQFRRQLGFAPTHFAYPWMMGSSQSLELAKQFGIQTVFGVALDYRRARNPRLPVHAFGRLKADWLPLLPGEGRARFLSIAAAKVTGISRTQHLAH